MSEILPFIVIIFMIILCDMVYAKIPRIGHIPVFIVLLLREFILLIGVRGKERKNLQAVGMINHKNVGCVSEA